MQALIMLCTQPQTCDILSGIFALVFCFVSSVIFRPCGRVHRICYQHSMQCCIRVVVGISRNAHIRSKSRREIALSCSAL